jgi:pilus assembly protein FimV
MTRKLVLLAVLVAFITENAYTLGLGDLKLDSSLNQAFDAEIELTGIGELGVEEMLPNLASQDDFDRVGVERSDILLDLRFKVESRSDGIMVVKISSTRPIIEPYLNFLVEVLWPSGRLLREYTILLDPPVFGQGGIQPVQPAQTNTTDSRRVRPTQQQSGEIIAKTRMSATVPSRPSESGAQVMHDEFTKQGDTLWAIALRVRPDSSVSVQQTMLALQRANPEAFIRDNINLLKAGYVLRIPDMSAILEETFASAVEEVQIQNDDWEAYKGGEPAVAQLDATKRQRQAAPIDIENEEGELKLLAADTQEGIRAGDGGADDTRVAELTGDLAVAMEDMDRTRRANTDLNIRLDDLASQIETLSQLVQLKDDQLAELQSQLKMVQAMAEESAIEDEPEVPVTAVTQETGLMSNSLVLGGAGALVILVIIGGLIMRRRSAASDDEYDEDFEYEEDSDDDETSFIGAEAQAEVLETGFEDEDVELEDASPQTADVIGEVDIYVAYGRFPQAVTFLKNAISAEPLRTDIQLKLLEVYAQTNEIAEFNLQYAQLKELGDGEANEAAAALQARLPGAAEVAEAALGATVISTDPIAAIEEFTEDDDLSFDLDDLDSETDEDELDIDDLDLMDDLEEEEELELDIDEDILDLGGDDTDDLELDLDLDLGDDDAGDLDLDLDDLSFDLDSDDDLSLDDSFSLDLDGDSDEDSGSKLDLARAYIDMGDSDSARTALEDVAVSGSVDEQKAAEELLEKIS